MFNVVNALITEIYHMNLKQVQITHIGYEINPIQFEKSTYQAIVQSLLNFISYYCV